MLLELSIRNFAVLKDTRLEFSRGLNALTGETGAGKSIVIDALGAVLGARTSSEFVRSDTKSAFVEATFDLGACSDANTVVDLLTDLGIERDPGEMLVLSREVTSAGRSTSRINGRTFPATALATLGGLLVDIHGQSDHLSLLRPAVQLDLLDSFAGTLPLRRALAEEYAMWQSTKQRLRAFDVEQREREQRIDLLRFQRDELGGAAVRVGEDFELARERDLLANAERLARSADEALAAIAGDRLSAEIDGGSLDRLRAAERAIEDIASTDPVQEALLIRFRDALFTLDDIAVQLRKYLEQIEFDPTRLEAINERLDLMRRLKRKYGPELEDVIAYCDAVETELAGLDLDFEDLEGLRLHEQRIAERLGALAIDLTRERREAAENLARRVENAIAELNMGHAEFSVRFDTQPDPDGVRLGESGELVRIDSTGVDRVDFWLAANAGEELRPLGRVASGGETARLMLALKSILSDADNTPTLVFDEIDVGVGGRSGQVVGEKLWRLTERHQAIVISHLPQIAAFADRHLTLQKREVGGRTETSAVVIDGPERIEEIAAMFDGLPPTRESRANATALLHRVAEWKRTHALKSEGLL